jgi:copper chaperone CopZ
VDKEDSMESTRAATTLERAPADVLFVKSAFDVQNMHCSTCASTLERVLGSLPGVRRAVVFVTGRVEVNANPDLTATEDLLQALENGGFHATLVRG